MKSNVPHRKGFPYMNDILYIFDGKPRNYRYLHILIQKSYGKAQRCESKLCTGLSKSFQWSNVSGTYSTSARSDWKQLCRSCHIILDKGGTARKPIDQLSREGTFVRGWSSATEACERLGIKRSSISSAISGRYDMAGGYKWRFSDTNKSS